MIRLESKSNLAFYYFNVQNIFDFLRFTAFSPPKIDLPCIRTNHTFIQNKETAHG